MKKWEKPRLIILVRGKPEESVLEGCKTQDQVPAIPFTSDMGCHYYDCNTCVLDVTS